MSKSLLSSKSRIKGRMLTSAKAKNEDFSRIKSSQRKPLTESSNLFRNQIEEIKSIVPSKENVSSLAVNNRSIDLVLNEKKLSKQVESKSLEDIKIEESSIDTVADIPLESTNKLETDADESNELDYYNDDFESYESDFEDDNTSDKTTNESVSEGTEISEASSFSQSDPPIPGEISDENNELMKSEINAIPRTATEDPGQRPKTSKAIVNFAKAKETQIKKQASEKIKSRGQILWEMIQLDEISIDLYTQIPESYEAFINAFGSENKSLASVQTNEDNLNDSVQTDDCPMLSKWTQKPIHISMDGNEMPSVHDYLGVGGEDCQVHSYYSAQTSSTFMTFLTTSANVVLHLLEESLSSPYDDFKESGSNTSSLGRRIKLGSGIEQLLANRSAILATFCPSDPSILVTGYSPSHEHNSPGLDLSLVDETESPSDDLESASLLCMWSVHQPSMPQAILYARALPLVATFSPGKPVVVISGMSDGSLCCWDLREESKNHKQFPLVDCRIQPPSYMTNCDEGIKSSGSPIIAIHTLDIDNQISAEHKGSFQLVTLSSDGEITWWVIVQEVNNGNSGVVMPQLGAAPWSCIALLKSAQQHATDLLAQEILVVGSELCCDLQLSGREKSHLFVAMTTGVVLQISRYHVKLRPHFIPEIQPGTKATSISVNPHDPSFILVGSSDGTIRLHSLSSTLPITHWQALTDPSPVRKVFWSQSRPCVFYMLDDTGCFHTWDLCAGDIYPVSSLKPDELISKGKINTMGLGGKLADIESNTFYCVFGGDSDGFVLCPITSQYISLSKEDYENELEQFRCYVSII